MSNNNKHLPRRARKLTLQPKDYIRAIVRTGGFITKAAELLGVTYQSVQDKIKDWPEVKEAYEFVIEKRFDMTESKLFQAIANGEPWAVMFFLRYKGRKRGYMEKAQVDVKGEMKNKTEIDLSQITTEDLKKMKKILDNANSRIKRNK